MDRFSGISGLEYLYYNQFVKHYGTRENINDILNPKIIGFGDFEFPRGSLYHYLPDVIGEIGPNNNSRFLNTYPGRVGVKFDWGFEPELEPNGIKIKPIQKESTEVNYFKSHFSYTRIRDLNVFLGKENDLIVIDHAPAFANVVYRRKTVFTPFITYHNTLTTLIQSVNTVADISTRHQFFEIKLPNTLPSFIEIITAYKHYKKFFNDKGEIVKYVREGLKPFQANKAFWVLDLFALLQGHENTKFSVFSKLTSSALEKTSIIFTYNGKAITANIQTLLNLIGSKDKKDVTSTTKARINSFKRFYLNLFSLVAEVNPTDLIKGDVNEPVGTTDIPQSVDMGSDDSPGSLANSREHSEGGSGDIIGEKGIEGGQGDNQDAGEPSITQTLDDDVTDIDAEIDNSVFELMSVDNSQTVGNVSKVKFSPTNTVERLLNQKAKEGKLTNKEKEYFLSLANTYKDLTIGGRTIEEIIDIKPKDMVMKKEVIASDSETIVDKSVLSSRSVNLTSNYIKKLHTRNIVEMLIYSQNAGICITDMDVETITTARSKYDVWKVKIQAVNGSSSTRQISIPHVEKDGTFKVNGVTSYMQLQRMEKPVRKIRANAVQLTSYYDKPRIIIETSNRVVDDYPKWLRLRIINSGKVNDDIKVSLGGHPAHDKNMCYYYSILASRFKEIETSEYSFNFKTEEVVGDDEAGKALCNSDSWVIGKKGNDYITIDDTGMVMINNQVPIGEIESLLHIDTAKAPLPVATINIAGYKFPVIVVLSYWMGFSKVLKALNVEYRTAEPNTRVVLEPDEFVIPFADEKLIFSRKNRLATLVVSGLLKIKNIGDYTQSYLDDSNVWYSLMDNPRVKPSQFKEMDNIFNMFIDPITKRLLERENYPTVMNELVLSVLTLILNEYAPNEVEITEQRFVGYERFSGHIYRELCKAARQFNNKPMGGKRTFDINPDAVMMNIITDSSVQAVEEVNPFHQCKQQDEVTYGGTLGRAEKAMVRRTRGAQPNYTGIISEAGKDSGKVGFITYLTVDPKVVDYYGNVDVTQEATKSGQGSIIMNTLYGGTRDDVKRLRVVV